MKNTPENLDANNWHVIRPILITFFRLYINDQFRVNFQKKLTFAEWIGLKQLGTLFNELSAETIINEEMLQVSHVIKLDLRGSFTCAHCEQIDSYHTKELIYDLHLWLRQTANEFKSLRDKHWNYSVEVYIFNKTVEGNISYVKKYEVEQSAAELYSLVVQHQGLAIALIRRLYGPHKVP